MIFLFFFVDFVFFFLHIAKVNFYGYMGFVDFVYSQGRFYDYIVCFFLFRS